MKDKLKASEFTVNRNAAAKFLGVSYRLLGTLDIPYFKIGSSHIRYRQKDLDKLQEEGIHNAGSVKA